MNSTDASEIAITPNRSARDKQLIRHSLVSQILVVRQSTTSIYSVRIAGNNKCSKNFLILLASGITTLSGQVDSLFKSSSSVTHSIKHPSN